MGRVVEFPNPPVHPGAPKSSRAAKPLWRHALGDVLRGERLEQERILTEVAQTAGVSPQYLSEVERGRKEASSEVLGAVSDALGLELAEVVGRVAERLAVRTAERDIRTTAGTHPRLEQPTALAAPADSLTGAFLLAA
ncbi:helix-turn-helix domain-containing protein [Agromyces aurantiacus]|uniref:Helix-turn-helix domain-containing protein n=1 Tax=Agromyces aurantiacus TaxID=165814 RepID=A0ABV9R7G0_9MICO|nr:helix-turn-helix transcriptional regulator [Agromyces aurantiacus]MBM7503872.1 transcriptional regulator with XRE-family HTH domain [Agromyces aurantiacus]